jgi:Tol biopolymer transport system component
MRRALALVASLLAALPAAALASGRYDPRLRFQTLSTPRFDIHFHQGEEAAARRLAVMAEDVAREVDRTLGPPSGRVQVILVAQSDLSNGWATPLPYNTIELTVSAPAGDSIIGNTSDWLRLVFTHEYTHVVHLSRGRGWIGGLRRAFGRMPVLFPNLFVPLWQIEGIATYAETAATGEGRVRDSSFRAILDVSAPSRFESLDRAGGGLVDWPGGNVTYLYGSFFHQYLADTYGDASIRALTDDSAGRVPYIGAPAFRKVFGKPLGDLWKDFEAASRRPPAPLTAERLTHHGFNVRAPRFGPDGRLYYSLADPHAFPALLALAIGSARPHKVANRYLGESTSFAGRRIVFDQIEIENHVGTQSDLYLVDERGGVRRLTHGARAGAPDVSHDGRTIVCTVQREDRRELVTYELTAEGRLTAPRPLISEAGVSYASPRWSPDDALVAAERGAGEIVLIDSSSRRIVRSLTMTGGARLAAPSWTPDGRLLFTSDHGNAGFRIYRADLKTLRLATIGGTGVDAREPAVSADGRSLVYVGVTADGYDLYTTNADERAWTAVDDGVLQGRGTPRAGVPLDAARTSAPAAPYSPKATIAPRFWTPIVESDNEELVVGAATASADALGRHLYTAQAGWATSRARPDWSASYLYDRWWPSLFANYQDDTDPWRGEDLRTREVNAGAILPFRRIRWSHALLAALHASTDDLSCDGCETPARAIGRQSLRGGWTLNAARAYGYSISTEDGWRAAATMELTRGAFGAHGRGGAATLDVRGYVPMVPRHGVLAVRAAGATTWGDDEVRRVFSASGHGPQPGGFRFGSDAIGLIRGIADDEVIGVHAAAANLDYRFPLVRIDRGQGTLPIFARVLHGALFADAGNAWNGTFRRADVRYSLGGELSLDAVIGYALPLTFTAGAAWVSSDRRVAVFGRIGRAF